MIVDPYEASIFAAKNERDQVTATDAARAHAVLCQFCNRKIIFVQDLNGTRRFTLDAAPNEHGDYCLAAWNTRWLWASDDVPQDEDERFSRHRCR